MRTFPQQHVFQCVFQLRSPRLTASEKHAQLLWQYGDRHYHAKRWSEAADWFIAGSHKLFRVDSHTTSAKCFRKGALCYMEQREYARASMLIRRCPENEAKTQYVLFLTAVHQGTLWTRCIILLHDVTDISTRLRG